MGPGDDESIRVQLARIEGNLAVIIERLANLQNEIMDIRRTVYAHSDRLGILEADKHIRSGERQGLALGGRILWTIIGALPVGIAAWLIKSFGL